MANSLAGSLCPMEGGGLTRHAENAWARMASMGVRFDVLIAAVGGNELDDGANVVRAGFENQPIQHVWAMAQDQHANQLVNKGLRGFHGREIEQYFGALCQRLFNLLTQRHSRSTGTNEVAASILGQGNIGAHSVFETLTVEFTRIIET